MPSITGNVGSTAQHVPAWKKLGLKLKSAKDLPIHSENSSNNEANVRKRKVVDDETAVNEVESVKQPRPKHSITQTPPALAVSVIEPPEANVKNDDPHGADASSKLPTTPLRKRKSVAFTPETKLEDGDSTKQLFYGWIAEQIAKDPSFDPQVLGKAFNPEVFGKAFNLPEPRRTIEQVTEGEVKQPTSKKKKKSLQNTDRPTVPSTSSTEHGTTTHPAVTYLQQYHASRPSWKFNKAKQTYILKHLFDIDKLPPSLDPALTAYIEGLQGADARSRVRKAAEDVRDEDAKAQEAVRQENMEDAVRRQEYYDRALKDYQAQLKAQVEEQADLAEELDPEWRLKYLKRRRAERILWSMPDTSVVTDHAVPLQRAALPGVDRSGADGGGDKRFKANDGTVRRRRKRRTGSSADDESSSSSSASSSSSSRDDRGEGSSSADGTSSDSETSSESEEGTDSSDSSSSSSSSGPSSSSSSGNSSKSAHSDQEGSDSGGSSNSN